MPLVNTPDSDRADIELPKIEVINRIHNTLARTAIS